MTASPFREPAPARRSARWLRRGSGALLASATVHAAAVVTIGGVLGAARWTPRAGHEPDRVVEVELDVDVAAAARAPARVPAPQSAPAPTSAASGSPTAGPTPVRAEPHRRQAAQPVHVAIAAPLEEAAASIAAPSPTAPPPLRFALSAGTVASGPGLFLPPDPAPPAGSGAASPASSAALPEREVDVAARVRTTVPLVYPPAAEQAEIEVDLPVEIVVAADGRVVSARVVAPAGYGLDEAALRAIRAYRFSPALRAGRAVPVRMRWIVQFRLR